MFETVDDVNQKLGSSIIFKNGVPIYVKGCSAAVTRPEDLCISYYDMPVGGYSKECSVWDPSLDWKTPSSRLGYINTTYDVGYHDGCLIRRIPIRKSIQGLSRQNLNIPRIRGMTDLGYPDRSTDFEHLIRKESILDMLSGRYPNIREAADILIKNRTFVGVAFNRDFCLVQRSVGPYYLEYKGKEIAWADDPTHRFKLGHHFEYLKETLEYNQIAYK